MPGPGSPDGGRNADLQQEKQTGTGLPIETLRNEAWFDKFGYVLSVCTPFLIPFITPRLTRENLLFWVSAITCITRALSSLMKRGLLFPSVKTRTSRGESPIFSFLNTNSRPLIAPCLCYTPTCLSYARLVRDVLTISGRTTITSSSSIIRITQ